MFLIFRKHIKARESTYKFHLWVKELNECISNVTKYTKNHKVVEFLGNQTRFE